MEPSMDVIFSDYVVNCSYQMLTFDNMFVAARIVRGGIPTIQSLPVWRNSLDIFDELHTAGERVN